MKIRQAFVSNSSSSSFLIYGICLNDNDNNFIEDEWDKIKENFKNKYNNDETIIEFLYMECYDFIKEFFDYMSDKIDLQYFDINDYIYIGDSPVSMPNDMTMGEFKNNIKTEIINLLCLNNIEDLDNKLRLEFLEEAYYS